MLDLAYPSVLLDYSAFEALSGFYRQKDGLSMGEVVSPSFANIFVNMLEQEIIKKHLDSKNIISYHRYVDDIFCIAK